MAARHRFHSQHLAALPDSIFAAPIASLQCPGNRISTLPSALTSQAASLTDLSLAANALDVLDGNVLGSLHALRALTLSDNRIAHLPDSIGNLVALEVASLSGNRLAALPARLGECVALRTLTLADNELQSLPAAIGNLTSLRTLRLDRNAALTALPDELCALSRLEALSVRTPNQ